jgi:hypothetical protein
MGSHYLQIVMSQVQLKKLQSVAMISGKAIQARQARQDLRVNVGQEGEEALQVLPGLLELQGQQESGLEDLQELRE